MIDYNIFPMIGGEKELPFYLIGNGIQKRQRHEIRMNGFYVNQIIYCTGGEGVLKVYDKDYSITSGVSFYLPPQVPHEYYPVSDVWETHWLTFSGYHVNELMNSFGLQNAGVFPLTDINKLDSIFRRIARTVTEDRMYGNYYASGFLYDYLLEYYRQISRKFNFEENEEGSPVILTVVNYIDQYYQNQITMEQLCMITGVSPQHLCRLFKKHLNARPMEYIAKKRLHEAKSLLRDTSKSISEVAEETGFHKPDYFTTLFKRYEGILPSEYRKLLQ